VIGLGKPQWLAKFEVTGFIYYGNIRVFGFADPMFPIRYATVVELRLQQMGDFYEKLHFTMESLNFGKL